MRTDRKTAVRTGAAAKKSTLADEEGGWLMGASSPRRSKEPLFATDVVAATRTAPRAEPGGAMAGTLALPARVIPENERVHKID